MEIGEIFTQIFI